MIQRDMGFIRTDIQLDNILENSQINMFQGLMSISLIMTTGLSSEIIEIENSWIKQSCLIRLLESRFSSNAQKQKAADELSRLVFDRANPDGYWNVNYSSSNYSQ